MFPSGSYITKSADYGDYVIGAALLFICVSAKTTTGHFYEAWLRDVT